MKYVLVLLFVPVVLACFVPQEGTINESVSFCSNVFYDSVMISGRNIVVDCNSAVFSGKGRGFSIDDSENITIRDCHLVNFDVGFFVFNSSNVFLENNHLLHTRIGSRFILVEDSAVFNNDVSLEDSFDVVESKNNIFSLSNRVVRGDFCDSNFCNQPRNSVELFVSPKINLASWLNEQLNLEYCFYDWVFSNLSN